MEWHARSPRTAILRAALQVGQRKYEAVSGAIWEMLKRVEFAAFAPEICTVATKVSGLDYGTIMGGRGSETCGRSGRGSCDVLAG
ncbi:hypothetical protein M3J09_006505 [Ascochyta lentis]